MTKEDKEKAEFLEEKISCIQSDIDRLCEIVKLAEEKNAKITLSYLVGVKLEEDGECKDCEIISDVSPSVDYSIDELISWLFTKKRLMEIDLNQLKVC